LAKKREDPVQSSRSCPACGKAAFSSFKKVCIGPLRGKPCEHCGINLSVKWGQSVSIILLMNVSMCVASIAAVYITSPITDLAVTIVSVLVGAVLAAIPSLWAYVHFVPIVVKDAPAHKNKDARMV
jgi:hypothetical protein